MATGTENESSHEPLGDAFEPALNACSPSPDQLAGSPVGPESEPDLEWLEGLPEDVRASLLVEAEQVLAQGQLFDYRPYPKQQLFHEQGATKRERLLRAGNQLGKTLATGAEVAYHLTGLYPEGWKGRRWNRPVTVWASGETAEATRDNPQRVLCGPIGALGTGMVPGDRLLAKEPGGSGKAAGTSDLYDYVRVKHVSGGFSLLRFKYYAQGRLKWQGPPVDFVWFDEEPPVDIYSEGLARTIATGGCVALSFTPLLGMSEVVKRFLGEDHEDRGDVNMTIEDAEHIPAEERARIIASFPEHEREARARGVPILGSGRIFPISEEHITCEPFQPPSYWPQLGALDFGYDHPFAAVRLYYDRDTDTIFVAAVHKERKATPVIHAATLKPWGSWLPWTWPHDGLQHDKGGGIQLRQQYRDQGLAMLPEHAQFPDTGEAGSRISVEAGLMELLERMLTGRLKVFKHLHEWFEEFRLYHRKDGKVVKVNDDLLDATRYGMMMIRYAISPREAGHREARRRHPELMPKRTPRYNPHNRRLVARA